MASREISAVLEEPGKMSIQEFDIPAIGPEEALLRVEMVGICGSDPKYYHGEVAHCSYPTILGHEMLGHIAAIGEIASSRYGVRVGDRVTLEASIPCGHCRYCLSGNYRICDNKRGYGSRVPTTVAPSLWGAYGQFMYIAPGSVVHRVSPSVPAEAAVLANAVIANGIQWVRIIGGASIAQAVVVQGAGPQGLAMTVAAKESGAFPIIITGLSADQDRLELAKEFGADYCIDVQQEDPVARVQQITGGLMADLVVDVTGSGQAIQKSLEMVRKQGTVICAGLAGVRNLTPLPTDSILSREIRFQGVLSKGTEAVIAAIKLIESGRYPLEKMVTHKYPLEAAEEAVRAVGREVPGISPIKAILVPPP